MSLKQRPNDGPGANGLRGGKNIYSKKTTIGNWVDEWGGPQFYKRGFSISDFETEAQNQQKGAMKEIPLYFGADLPAPASIRTKKPTTFDVFCPEGTNASHWVTTATATMGNGGKALVPESHLLPSNISHQQLQEYHKHWTSDTPCARTMRFTTENRRQGNAANKLFQTPSLRLLPGTPRILETFRENLIERYGVLALVVARFYVGKGIITCNELKTGISKIGIKLSPPQVNQILAFFTPTNNLDADYFMKILVAKMDGFNEEDIRILYSNLASPSVIDGVKARLNYDIHPEVAQGISENISIYGTDENFTVDDFVQLHLDLYSAKPSAFDDLIKALWI